VDGNLTRGMLVVDKANVSGNPPNVQLITSVNTTAYEKLLIWAAGGPPPAPSTSSALGGQPKRPRLM